MVTMTTDKKKALLLLTPDSTRAPAADRCGPARARYVDKSEKRFSAVLTISAFFMVVLLLAVFFTLLVSSIPAIKTFGVAFFYGRTWNPATETFGALPFLVGTLLTSFLALALSIPF
ncbi:MAG TPA: hypothetical protein VGJ94_08715, partial [Syntrophorhabdaceae bacterium]